jgi:hypothetical protein
MPARLFGDGGLTRILGVQAARTSDGGGARALWGPLLAGADDTGSRPKYGGAMVLVGVKMAIETTGVPSIKAHVDMTQAGPHGQTGGAPCPEA